MAKTIDWFAHRLAVAHSPHGPALPIKMPCLGDLFVLENEDGSDTMWCWMGKWAKGPNLKRPENG